jgi:hypothetical protein
MRSARSRRPRPHVEELRLIDVELGRVALGSEEVKRLMTIPAVDATMEVELAQQRRDRGTLGGSSCSESQALPLRPEQLGGGAARHEVAVQDRLHLVL